MTDWISLSAEELFLLWWAADLGEPPTMLDLPRPGHTPERRAEYAAEASAALDARGLGTLSEPAPELRSALRHVANAATTVDLHVYGPHTGHALGALSDRAATVVVRVGGTVRIRRVTPGKLLPSLLDLLPPLPAAPGRPANVTATDYATACRRGEETGTAGFVQSLRAAGIREPDRTTLVRAVTGRTGGGQLGASGPDGRRFAPVTWVDTPAGRFAMRERAGWVTVTPADGTRLATMAGAVLADR